MKNIPLILSEIPLDVICCILPQITQITQITQKNICENLCNLWLTGDKQLYIYMKRDKLFHFESHENAPGFKFQDPNSKTQIPRELSLGTWALRLGTWVFKRMYKFTPCKV